MARNIFASVGSFSMTPPFYRGITVYRYDAALGELTLPKNSFEDINVGYQFLDEAKNILYICHEAPSFRGKTGGAIAAINIDPLTGRLSILNEKETLCPQPSWFCLDNTKKFALISHFGSENVVTKIKKQNDGKYISYTDYDDCLLELVSINDDGSIGEICDLEIFYGEGIPGSCSSPALHSCLADPSGELFLVCAMRKDSIYSYRIDRNKNKLIKKAELILERETGPRYVTFHPLLPLVYCNNEFMSVLFVYSYDVRFGILKKVQEIGLLTENDKKISKSFPSDLLMSPDGKTLYVSIRGVNIISALRIASDGSLELFQNIDSGGDNPRGICMSPDGRYFFALNNRSENIVNFNVKRDGSLEISGKEIRQRRPANMRFFTTL
jgi:6-phosphogluconolactonase (cycloisomerase 2 family)